MQLSLYQVALSLLLRVHVTVPGRREAMCGDNKPNYVHVHVVKFDFYGHAAAELNYSDLSKCTFTDPSLARFRV